jgi:hypothetical protein
MLLAPPYLWPVNPDQALNIVPWNHPSIALSNPALHQGDRQIFIGDCFWLHLIFGPADDYDRLENLLRLFLSYQIRKGHPQSFRNFYQVSPIIPPPPLPSQLFAQKIGRHSTSSRELFLVIGTLFRFPAPFKDVENYWGRGDLKRGFR